MKGKTTIRYLRFRPARDGGRIFDFCVSENERPDRPMSVEIPVTFFEGENRIHLQEGVGISYAKLKHFVEFAESSEGPRTIRIDARDLSLLRQAAPSITKRRPGPTLPGSSR
ncbi:MAG TPA: hypothetical protein VFR18_11165 [Terriglobia bacterium]|nr:hypothetical protein [Terriglobia bacterium]